MHWADRAGRRLKLRDLHVLLAVVEWGSMARAADRLAISRPAVSKAIADLEHVLGVSLLERSVAGVVPTHFGRALLKRSGVIFDELRQSVREIEFLADPTVGELSVGASEPIAAGVLAAVIERLSRKHPKLVFNVEQDDAATLQARHLRERRIELAIARMLPGPADDIKAEVLFHERLFVAAGNRSKWAGRRKLTLAELAEEPWILAPLELSPGSPVIDAFRAAGVQVPRAQVLGYSLPLRATLLASGRFLTIVPGSVLRYSAERLSLTALPLDLPSWHEPVAVLTLRNRVLSPVAELFIDCAREAAKPLVDMYRNGEVRPQSDSITPPSATPATAGTARSRRRSRRR
jgi:DNA-binding transcriptional LysR family regulator